MPAPLKTALVPGQRLARTLPDSVRLTETSMPDQSLLRRVLIRHLHNDSTAGKICEP